MINDKKNSVHQPETSDKTCVEPNTMQPKPSQGQNNGPPIIPQQWMPIPTKIPGCPPGLEYLTVLDQLLIHQDVELVEAFTGFETKNKFKIKNSVGQQCYFAYEESSCFQRCCCGNAREFVMHVVDNTGYEVMRISRPLKLCAGCCWCASADCCSFSLFVEAPVGNPIGSIHQAQSCWKPKYLVKDASGNHIFDIKGPCCVLSGPCCTCEIPFEIFSPGSIGGDVPVGKITRQYGGFAKEFFTDATNFSLTFPIDLEVKVKAVLVAATFLIDIMFFEQTDN